MCIYKCGNVEICICMCMRVYVCMFMCRGPGEGHSPIDVTGAGGEGEGRRLRGSQFRASTVAQGYILLHSLILGMGNRY